jgi:hypothetical protein
MRLLSPHRKCSEQGGKLQKPPMELLLNLVWMSLVPLAVFGFLRGRSASPHLAGVPYRKSLVALGFAMVLLFPVVSASDDLHPTQAVLEEASKRVKRAVAVLHELQPSSPPSMLPVRLAFYLMFALIIVSQWRPLACVKFALEGVDVPSAGRAPPASRWI